MSRRLHVMATEDDVALRDLLAEILEGEGHRTSFSTVQDVDAVAADPPDLLLLDGRGLPGDSGWDFLERLKADQRTATIPVLVLTGEGWAVEGHAERLAALDTVLVLKPFNLADLVGQVSRRLRGEPA